jgi:SWI/SNF-related matrix-associated actin-dependent regulator 1 of chromatin subfamily A
MVIADESSRYISNHLTQRAKALITIGDGVSHKLILTGTLIASKPMGLWSQFRFLDDGESFGENFYAWRNYFFAKIKLGKYNKWVLREDRKRILERRIFRKCIAINNRDVIADLPPIRFQRVMMNMDKDFAADYRAVQNQIIAEVEAREEKAIVNAQHIFAKLVRLQQMTSGFVGDIDKNVKILKNKPKLELLMEYINEIIDSDESVVVWCRFRPSIKLISDELKKYKIKHTTMSGEDNTAAKKYKKWKGFQEDNSIKVFVGQIAAGGIGIELFKIESDDEYEHMIFYENTFTLDHRTQAIGRRYGRIGQNSKVRVIDLIMKDTIDEKIIKSIEKDKEVADGIMKYGIRKFLESKDYENTLSEEALLEEKLAMDFDRNLINS